MSSPHCRPRARQSSPLETPDTARSRAAEAHALRGPREACAALVTNGWRAAAGCSRRARRCRRRPAPFPSTRERSGEIEVEAIYRVRVSGAALGLEAPTSLVRGDPHDAAHGLRAAVSGGEAHPQDLALRAPGDVEREVAIVEEREIEPLVYVEEIRASHEHRVLLEVLLPEVMTWIIEQHAAHLHGRSLEAAFGRELDAGPRLAAMDPDAPRFADWIPALRGERACRRGRARLGGSDARRGRDPEGGGRRLRRCAAAHPARRRRNAGARDGEEESRQHGWRDSVHAAAHATHLPRSVSACGPSATARA